MATFEAQVEALTTISIDGSSNPNQTQLTQFLTDGAKEVLNAEYYCAANKRGIYFRRSSSRIYCSRP